MKRERERERGRERDRDGTRERETREIFARFSVYFIIVCPCSRCLEDPWSWFFFTFLLFFSLQYYSIGHSYYTFRLFYLYLHHLFLLLLLLLLLFPHFSNLFPFIFWYFCIICRALKRDQMCLKAWNTLFWNPLFRQI